jgi:lipid II:glycine glycyltransferase (peptidoglycan interpeptide bridge formation enzyme)
MNAAYLLQWAAIQKAKALGCQWYDLGGIDPEGNPGVYNFKKRMGGKEIILPGPFQITPGGWNTMVCTFGEKVFTFLKQYLVK